jgi:hypothetical protein
MPLRVLEGTPGAGKTKRIVQRFVDNPAVRKIYLANSHERLNEIKQWFDSAGLSYTHWKGMKTLCPLKSLDPIKTMIEYNAPTRWICKLCQSPELNLIDPEKCLYLEQFKNPEKIVLAPVIYLMLEQVKTYDPKIVAIDDVISYIHRLPSLTEMNSWLNELNSNHCTRGRISRYSNLREIFKEQGHRIEAYVKEIENNLKEWITAIKENAKLLEPPYEYSIEAAITNARDVIRRLLRIDPTTIIEWHKFVETYGFRDSFARLHILEAFELSLDRDVYIVNALPNKWFIDAMILRFEKETGLTLVPQYEEIKTEKPIAKSTVYRMRSKDRPDAWYPTNSSIVHCMATRKKIRNQIGRLLGTYSGKQLVGLIRPKGASIQSLIEPTLTEDVRSLHFGDLRGSNSMLECNPIFVVGTYQVNPESLEEDFKVVFNVDPIIGTHKLDDGNWRYADLRLNKYKEMFEEQEMYHAIHCGRLAFHEKTAYVFGVIPEEIKKELAVKDLFPEEKDGEVVFLEETRFVTMLDTLIGEMGEYNATLVKVISDELGLAKEWTSTKIKNHVEQNPKKYHVKEEKIGNQRLKFIQKL